MRSFTGFLFCFGLSCQVHDIQLDETHPLVSSPDAGIPEIIPQPGEKAGMGGSSGLGGFAGSGGAGKIGVGGLSGIGGLGGTGSSGGAGMSAGSAGAVSALDCKQGVCLSNAQTEWTVQVGSDSAIVADLEVQNMTDAQVTLSWLQFYLAAIGQAWDDRSNLCTWKKTGDCAAAMDWNFPRLFFGDAMTGQWLLGPIFPAVFNSPGNWHVPYTATEMTDVQAMLDFKIYPDSQGMVVSAKSKRRFVVYADIRQNTVGDLTQTRYLVWLLNFATEPKVPVFHQNLQPQQGVWGRVKVEH